MTPEDLAAVAATEVQRLERMSHLGDSPTAGPTPTPPDAPSQLPMTSRWSGGWWYAARRLAAHPGRVGGVISPWSTVVHTTDMLPDEWAALINSWTTRAGEGACAHFLLGRTPADGVVQFIPVNRNGNHAGGPGHGVYVVDGQELHPNTCAVGIEVHCAGGVRSVAGEWRLVEGQIAHGAPLASSDVDIDPARPGRAWHVVTDYQRTTLATLLRDLDRILAPMPAGAVTKAFGEIPPAYAVQPTARVVTHAQLDPVHRADPWPPLSEWLKRS